MGADNNVMITKKARAGAVELPVIVGMAFGDGDMDASGSVIPPANAQTGLNNERFRKEIDGYRFPADTTCRYECTLTEHELTGEEIRKIGLSEANGDIVCIKSFTKKGKDVDLEMTTVLDDIF